MANKADGQRKLRKEKTRGKIQKHAAVKQKYKKKKWKERVDLEYIYTYTHSIYT